MDSELGRLPAIRPRRRQAEIPWYQETVCGPEEAGLSNLNVTASTRWDFFQRPGFLNVSGEKGNGIGAYDGQGEPDDAPKWPAKPIFFPH